MKNSSFKRILFIAFHYPPIVGSSGVYRTLSFSRYFAAQGWKVNVISASLRAYSSWSEKQYRLIPNEVKVTRAFCLDASKHLAVKGKHFSFLTIPDNWQSWILGGVISGIILAFKSKPTVIFSTFPIATAHIIGYCLHKILNVPWVADLRDPMAQGGYPANKSRRKVFLWIEKKIVECCEFAIVTTPSAKKYYMERYANSSDEFWKVLPNGYDDVTFNKVMKQWESQEKVINVEKVVLLHSGVIYPRERNPSFFFQAISNLKKQGSVSSDNLQIKLRATGHDEIFIQMIESLNISDIVSLHPTISYEEAIHEMLTVDGLILMQSVGCNKQIPAKSYEYIKVKKPILGLMPIEGDTGQLIAQYNISVIAPLDEVQKIQSAIITYIERIKTGNFTFLSENEIEQYSRSRQAQKLEQFVREI